MVHRKKILPKYSYVYHLCKAKLECYFICENVDYGFLKKKVTQTEYAFKGYFRFINFFNKMLIYKKKGYSLNKKISLKAST